MLSSAILPMISSFMEEEVCLQSDCKNANSSSDSYLELNLESGLVLTLKLLDFLISDVYKFALTDWLKKNDPKMLLLSILVRIPEVEVSSSDFKEDIKKYLKVNAK